MDETKQEIKERHSNFYWLAKYTKECVNWFGKRPLHQNIKQLYHGIGEEVQFTKIADKFRGVQLYGPVSTTSSFEVALHFTNCNNGLLLEFGISYDWISSGAYFPCSWLSDYSNESEYLFIQNESGFFKFTNIICTKTSVEYRPILNAIQIFHDLLQCQTQRDRGIFQSMIKEDWVELSDDEDGKVLGSEYIPIYIGGYYDNELRSQHKHEVAATISAPLIAKMIENELNTLNPRKYKQYERFSQLPTYGQQLFHQFCANETKINLHFKAFKSYGFTKLRKYFWMNDCKHMLQMEVIKDIFPNIQQIRLNSKRSNQETMKEIEQNLGEPFMDGLFRKLRNGLCRGDNRRVEIIKQMLYDEEYDSDAILQDFEEEVIYLQSNVGSSYLQSVGSIISNYLQKFRKKTKKKKNNRFSEIICLH
eukprot:166708_1